jgi:hypothetical protein
MWITGIFNGNTAYPHVDRLCIDSKKLFTVFNAIFSTAHLILSFVFAAANRSGAVLKFFHEHG